ncbi:MAG: glycerophosphodiester phosphodiesterase family protein [Eubacteriales bacterium]|nr:glycerophosphodiester phosphodiesterase family protein [Eubacteriales bacterium]
MKNILAEGHRGYAAKYPENTLASYRAAMELGVDAIEFDVWLTADGVPVLIHDGNTARVTGVDASVGALTLSELKKLSAGRMKGPEFENERIPTLCEALSLMRDTRPRDLRLGVEIKDYHEETVDKTVALLREYDYFDTCWFYAFNARILKYIKTVYGGRTMGYPDFQMAEFEPDSYSYYDELGLSMRLVRSELFPFYAAKGFPMHMYCADTEADVRECIEKGASLITANDPVPLLTLLGRR